MNDPVLWHLTFSNYNEKARWALDFKRIAHQRRAMPPLLHSIWARRIGGGRTFPVLVFGDGEVAGDSTSIVAELERRHPDPPLYPGDPAERAHALELERFFTDETGHAIRRLALDHLRRHPELGANLMAGGLPLVPQAAVRPLAAPFTTVLGRYFGVSAASVERAWQELDAAIDRFHAELGPDGYLAGDRFTVADLTFAALVGTLTHPPGFPYPPRDPRLRGLPELCALLSERGVLEWIEDVYARHRGEWVRPHR